MNGIVTIKSKMDKVKILVVTFSLGPLTPKQSRMSDTINVLIEFGGGTELLTSTPTQKKHSIQLPKLVSDKTPLTSNSSSTSKDLPEPSITTPNGSSRPNSDQEGEKKRPVDVRFCVQWIKKNLIVEREELFLDGETVRPGILVLINSADWELEGELNYQLQDKDELVFISTLHGG